MTSQYKCILVGIAFIFAMIFLPVSVEEPVSNQTKYERCIQSFDGNDSKVIKCNEYLGK